MEHVGTKYSGTCRTGDSGACRAGNSGCRTDFKMFNHWPSNALIFLDIARSAHKYKCIFRIMVYARTLAQSC